MNNLEAAFARTGFAFRLLRRSGDVALFEKRKPTHSRESFEVVIVQRHPAEQIDGRDYPERESMPKTEAWGTSGWTFTDIDNAKRKFRSVVESRQEVAFQQAATLASAFSSTRNLTTGRST